MLSGLTPTAKAIHLSLLWQALEQPVLVVTESNRSAEALMELLETLYDFQLQGTGAPRPMLIPALDVLPGQGLSPHTEIKEQRAVGLYRAASGHCSIVVTPVGSALLRVEESAFYRAQAGTCETLPRMPFGCGEGSCVAAEDLEGVRQWIAGGALMQ